MYACFDQPDLKATFTLTVTAPEHWTVHHQRPVGSRSRRPTAARWAFAETPRMSTYITALVAGPYHEVRDARTTASTSACSAARRWPSTSTPTSSSTVTKQGFDFYHRVFDYRYPFGKYDQLFVPEFNAGAMENAGA